MGDEDLMLDQMKRAIDGTVSEFQLHPVDFLYESDIQSLLFAKLRDEMREVRYEARAKDMELLFGSSPSINPVKTEYPLNLPTSRERFDVAVLSAEQDTNSRIWWQPCRIGIEIKLWQPEGTGKGPWDDIEKLRNYWEACNKANRPFTGVAMLFVHPGAERWLQNIDAKAISNDIKSDGIVMRVITASE